MTIRNIATVMTKMQDVLEHSPNKCWENSLMLGETVSSLFNEQFDTDHDAGLFTTALSGQKRDVAGWMNYLKENFYPKFEL